MEWSLADGTVPSTRCARCQRPTPILIHGLGFDCCGEDDYVPAETLQADEPGEQPAISHRFGLGLLAQSLAMIGVHWVWSAGL